MRITAADLRGLYARRTAGPATKPREVSGHARRLKRPATAQDGALRRLQRATGGPTGGPTGGVSLWLPGKLVNSLNQRGHWSHAARYRARWREMTALIGKPAARRWGEMPTYPKLVILTARTWGRYDDDGLAAALKPIVDGLVDAGLIHADTPESQSGHRIERRQVIDRKRRGVEVVIRCR